MTEFSVHRPFAGMIRYSLYAFFLLFMAGCNGSENGQQGPGPDEPGDREDVELVLNGVFPSKGPVSGGTELRLDGEGFLKGVANTAAIASLQTAVRFGEAPAARVEVISDSVITAITPPGLVGSMNVRVENPNGVALCEGCFEYEEEEENGVPGVEVRIERISPVRGPSRGGTRVRIEGAGFLFGFGQIGDNVRDRTAILFGENTAVDFDVIEDRIIEAVSPPGSAGARTIRVQNPNGEALCEDCFSYFVPLEVGSLSPSGVPLGGGVEVSVSGEGFTDETIATVGGRSVISPTSVDSNTFVFVAPPLGEPGAYDLVVMNSNGKATLRRGVSYFPEPLLSLVDPPYGSFEGGTRVRLVGKGLIGADSVSFGGTSVGDLEVSGGDLYVLTPPGQEGEVIDVQVAHEHGETTLTKAFSYIDPSRRDLSLLATSPALGPVEGGNSVLLVGTGLDDLQAEVRFGSNNAEVSEADANLVRVMVSPASGGAGIVDVQLRNNRGGALLEGAYTYEDALEVYAIEPRSGTRDGGTEVTILGEGFDEEVEVRIGALFAEDVRVLDATTLKAITPPGSSGAADIIVAGGADQAPQSAILPGGYYYEAPLLLLQVEPSRGAIAGGTYVVLSGEGFGEDLEVIFGDGRAAEVIEVIGTNLVAIKTPPGEPGSVDVRVVKDGEERVQPSAFNYYNPISSRGGASGGPMAGTINITAMDSYTSRPIDEASVMLGSEDDSPFQGLTDARGQITFSDASLVRPVQVSVWKRGYEAVSVSEIDTRDLTLFLTGIEFSMDEDQTSMPPPPPAAYINPRPGNGTVCGFKLPPDRVLAPNQREEARVWTTARSVTSLPPFRGMWSPNKVGVDCGQFGLASRPGSIALYAKYGILTEDVDSISGQVVETFEPLLMGITRGIEVPAINPPTCTANRSCPTGYSCDGEDKLDPANPASFRWCLCDSDSSCGEGRICNPSGACQEPVSASIVLSMHLDQDVELQIVNPPVPPDGSGRIDAAYAYLELGNEGAAFMGDAINTDGLDSFTIEGLPRLPSEGFVFLNMATSGGRMPFSVFFRREIGNLADGVALGPMQPMTRLISPALGVLTGKRIQWTYEGSPEPDVVIVQISEPGFVPLPIWQLIVPGDKTSVDIPSSIMEILRGYSFLQIQVNTALSPRFEFDYFSYRQLGAGAWNSFTQEAEFFAVQ